MSVLAGRRARALPAAAVLALAVVLAVVRAAHGPPALARGPGVWTDVSGSIGGLPVQPRVARDGAGVLHAVWITEGAKHGLVHRAIAADGAGRTMQTLVQD
jgi:hypothetical protein